LIARIEVEAGNIMSEAIWRLLILLFGTMVRKCDENQIEKGYCEKVINNLWIHKYTFVKSLAWRHTDENYR